MEATTSPNSTSAPTRKNRWLKFAAHSLILAVTIAALSGHLMRAWEQLAEKSLSIRAPWLVFSAICYAAGLSLQGFVWVWSINRLHGVVRWTRSLRAYLISHAGKYVPGKAMLVIIRMGLMAPEGVSASVTFRCTLFESLIIAGTGALVAVSIFLFGPLSDSYRRTILENPIAIWLTAAVGLGLTGATIPPLFQIASRILAIPFRNRPAGATVVVPWNLWIRSVSWMVATWSVMGLAFYSCAQSVSDQPIPAQGLLVSTAAVGMALALGFVSMLPGQAGVREWALIVTMAPFANDELTVVASSVVYRVVTLFVEFSLAAALYLGGRR